MDMLSFLYIASLFAIGGAAFSLMWRNISDLKKKQQEDMAQELTQRHQKMERRYYMWV